MKDIKEVAAWDFAGRLYTSKNEAIEANLTEIGHDIVRNHSNHPLQGLLAHKDDLVELLSGLTEVTSVESSANENTESFSSEGTRSKAAGRTRQGGGKQEHNAIMKEVMGH